MVVRIPVRGGHHDLELPARKGRDSRVGAWRNVHEAYGGVVRECRFAIGNGSPRRRAKDITGDGGNTVPLSRNYRYSCEKICVCRLLHYQASGCLVRRFFAGSIFEQVSSVSHSTACANCCRDERGFGQLLIIGPRIARGFGV